MKKYKVVSKQGEGTFSKVLKAKCYDQGHSKETRGDCYFVAVKCMKLKYKSFQEAEDLREVQALRRLSSHPHIVKLIDLLYDEQTGKLAIVFELMKLNLYELTKDRKKPLEASLVEKYMLQLLRGLRHMHKLGFFHRDIKPENILVSGELLKLADLGSVQDCLSAPPFTEYISTRWYRAPECLLTDGYYGKEMDIWGVGCVMFEIIALFPLFPGGSELDQLEKIHHILGTPPKSLLRKYEDLCTHMEFAFVARKGVGITQFIPNASTSCLGLLKRLLLYDPRERISAKEALRHEYLSKQVRKLVSPAMLHGSKLKTRPHVRKQRAVTKCDVKEVNKKESAVKLPSLNLSRTVKKSRISKIAQPLHHRPTGKKKQMLPSLPLSSLEHSQCLQSKSISKHKRKGKHKKKPGMRTKLGTRDWRVIYNTKIEGRALAGKVAVKQS